MLGCGGSGEPVEILAVLGSLVRQLRAATGSSQLDQVLPTDYTSMQVALAQLPLGGPTRMEKSEVRE